MQDLPGLEEETTAQEGNPLSPCVSGGQVPLDTFGVITGN